MGHMRSLHLNQLHQVMVGDSQTPNVYFVTVGNDCQMISLDFNQAHQFWKGLAKTKKTSEPALSDRIYGVICSVEKGLDPSFPHGFTVTDNSADFLRTYLLSQG